MPYKSLKDVNPAIKGINPTPTLAQANLIAGWADSIKEKRGDVNPWGIAIAMFKRTHHVEGKDDNRKWVKNATGNAGESLADEFLALLAQLDEMELTGVIELFPWSGPSASPLPFYGEDGEPLAGEPAYVVDLYADLPQTKEGKPDFSQPFRILPAGPIHRFGTTRVVDVADIAQFADNWQNRERRGIRRSKVVVDVEHEPGGIGLYQDIQSRGSDGLWAQITLTKRGEEVLAERDFFFFSPTVAWESQDRLTGDLIKNQVVGGALTNFPVFGNDTALPICGYSEAALHRLWQDGLIVAGYATKTESGVEYPSSAYIIVEDAQKPTTWHLRYKEYVNGKLTITPKMVGAAASALSPGGHRGQQVQLSPALKAKAKKELIRIYQNTLKVDKEKIPSHLFSQEGGTTMTEPQTTILETLADLVGGILKKGEPAMTNPKPATIEPVTEVSVEAFNALQKQVADQTARVEALSQERDALRTQVTQAQTQLTAEMYARQLVEMKALAESYSHLALPIELPKDAAQGTLTAQEHLAWLYNQDKDGRPHFAFFTALLKANNEALREADIMGERGSSGGAETDPDTQLHQKALAYASEHKVGYIEALRAVS